jgi:hypothetical protein
MRFVTDTRLTIVAPEFFFRPCLHRLVCNRKNAVIDSKGLTGLLASCCLRVLLQAFACTDEYATEKMPLLILKGLLVCLRAVA